MSGFTLLRSRARLCWAVPGGPLAAALGLTLAVQPIGAQVVLNGTNNSDNIGGSQTVSVTGGTNTLSGTNTYSGTTSITGGSLALSGGSAIGDTSAVTLANTGGVTLTLNANETIGSLAGGGGTGGNIALGDNFLTVGGDNTNTEFFGAMTGNNGGLTKIGSGTFTLSSSNTNWNGDTTINGGTLKATAFSVPWGSDLILANTAGVTFEIAYAGVERLAGLSGGGTTGGTVSIISGGTLQAGFNDATSQFDGVITGAGALDKIGTGTLTLGGANTFTGDTTITAGTLTLAHTDALQNSTLTTAAGLDFGTLTSATLGGLSGSDNLALINTDTTPAAVALTVGGNDATTVYSGNLSGTGGSLTKSGTGTLTLSGTNTHTGGTTVSAGTLGLGSATALGSGSITMSGGNLDNTSGSALTLTTNNAQNWNSDFTFVGTDNLNLGTGAVTLTAGRTVSVTANTLTAGGSINRTFTKAGNGTLRLTGTANVGLGEGYIVQGGTLALGSGFTHDTAALAIFGGFTYVSGSEASAPTFHLDGGNLDMFKVQTGTGTTNIDTFNGETGTLRISGGDLTTLSTAINAGELIMTGGTGTGLLTIGSGASNTATATISGGTWTDTDPINIAQFGANGSLTLSGSGSLDVPSINLNSNGVLSFGNGGTAGSTTATEIGGTGTVNFNHTGTLNISARIETSGAYNHLGSGTTTLSGDIAGQYTSPGAVGISAGTLQVSSGDSLQNNAVVTLSNISGATLGLSGANETIGALAGGGSTGGNVSLGSHTLTLGVSYSSGTNDYAGEISGTGEIIKAGPATQTLSGTNTYSGPTTINAGNLDLTGSAANSAFTVNNGGTLSGTGTLGSLTVNTGGILAPGNSPGTLTAGNTVWAGDAAFILELENATGTKGTNWDLLAISGTLTINATMANPFTINVDTLVNGTNTAGAMANFDANTSNEWVFVETTGGINFGTNASIGASFAVNTDDFANATNGTFAIAQIGNNLALTYSAVPEPGSFALVLSALALGFSATRRRKVRRYVRHSSAQRDVGGSS